MKEELDVYIIVEKLQKKDKDGHSLYKGICKKCGYVRIARYNDLKIKKECNHVSVCGMYKDAPNTWNEKTLRNIFKKMISRCYNESDKAYHWYGAKGIRICNEWLKNHSAFEKWALQNGYKKGLTIDRKNENEDYCPENCRWITLEDNAKYKSTTRLLEVDGEIHTGRDWAKILNIGLNTINKYVRTYGKEQTIEFIRRYKNNPNLKRNSNQSYFDLYMNQLNSNDKVPI